MKTTHEWISIRPMVYKCKICGCTKTNTYDSNSIYPITIYNDETTIRPKCIEREGKEVKKKKKSKNPFVRQLNLFEILDSQSKENPVFIDKPF